MIELADACAGLPTIGAATHGCHRMGTTNGYQAEQCRLLALKLLHRQFKPFRSTIKCNKKDHLLYQNNETPLIR